MSSFCIRKGRVKTLKLPKGYDVSKLCIGVPVTDGEDIRIGLKEIGDVVLPSPEFGPVCERNANGYSFIDKTQEKEYRYVSTVRTQPYGNESAYPILIDIYRTCYPREEVPPTEIELLLASDGEGNQYVAANLTEEVRKEHLTEAVNLFLEIYGFCYIYSDSFETFDAMPRRRCNWKILPPGEMPSEHLRQFFERQGKSSETFEVDRLEFVEEYTPENAVEGMNGFDGYYAYIFQGHCVLESAIYGNATYIIPKENWEEMSQRTKRELLDEHRVEMKIVHNQSWHENFSQAMYKLEGKV